MFKVGMRVRLRSGGPLMTITAMRVPGPSAPRSIMCEWFDKAGAPQSGWFIEEALMSQEGMT